jgi:tetratricopeptide (TPR) repeat protein
MRRIQFVLGCLVFSCLTLWVGRAGTQVILSSDLRGRYDSAGAYLNSGTVEGLSRADDILTSALSDAERQGDSVAVGLISSRLGIVRLFTDSASLVLPFFQRAIPLLRNNPRELASTHAWLGATHARLLGTPGIDHLDSIQVHLDSAISVAARAGDSTFLARISLKVGTEWMNINQLDRAEPLLQRAYDFARFERDTAYIVNAALNLGVLHENRLRREAALKVYSEARAFADSIGDTLGIAQAEMAIGELWSFAKEYGLALPYLEVAAVLSNRYNKELQFRALWSLAEAEYQTRLYARALQTVRRAHSILVELQRPQIEAKVQARIALLLVHLREYPAARREYMRADSLMRLSYEPPELDAQIAVLDQNRAILEVLAGDTTMALQHLTNALGYLDKPSSPDSASLARTLMTAAALVRPTNVDSALVLYFRALEIVRLHDVMARAAAMENIAVTFHLWKRPSDLPRALAYYDSAAAIALLIGPEVGGDEHQVAVAEGTAEWFGYAALAWAAQEQDPGVGQRQAYLGALGTAERGRARVLLEMMSSGARDTIPGVDLPSRTASLLHVLDRTDVAGGLYYHSTPDTLLIWLLLPSGEIHLRRAPVSNVWLRANVDSLRAGLRVEQRCEGSSPTGDTARILARLAAVLLPMEFRALLPPAGELIIFPHGDLNRLPFAALEVAPGELLGLRYALRFAPSLDVLESVESRNGYLPGRPTPRATLVVGNPEMPRVLICGDVIRPQQLEGAERSSKWVARLFGVRPLIGRNASESAVRHRLPEAAVIYFATHGYAYDSQEEARSSFITLTPTGPENPLGDSPTDGRLTVREIIEEVGELNAELVALSACRTGLGELTDGEGTVGLQRALLARGARSVLVSLWDVDDDASEVLLNAFFRHWRSGLPKAEALRLAQQNVRENPQWRSPRFWAAYQLAGGR